MEFEMDLETDEMILKSFRMNNMEILRQVEKQKKDTLFAMEHSLAWSAENTAWRDHKQVACKSILKCSLELRTPEKLVPAPSLASLPHMSKGVRICN